MHTDVIYDADLQMSWVNNCVKFKQAKHFILPIVFILYFLANKTLRGIICARIPNQTQYYRLFYEERKQNHFFIIQFGPNNFKSTQTRTWTQLIIELWQIANYVLITYSTKV